MPEPSLKQRQLRAQATRAARARALRASARPSVVTAPGEALPPPYAELHCLTHFSFQRGASSPEELVRRAWALGYSALAITDECSVAGVVRAWQTLGELERSMHDPAADNEWTPLHAARAATGVTAPLHLLYGSEFRFQAQPDTPGCAADLSEQGTLVALAQDLAGWGHLCTFITRCRGAAHKGDYRLPPLAVALAALSGCELLWAPCRGTLEGLVWGGRYDVQTGHMSGPGLNSASPPASFPNLAGKPCATESIAACADQGSAEGLFGLLSGLLLELHADHDDALHQLGLQQLAAATGLPLVAAGDVHMHVRARKRLQDVMTAIRLGRPVAQCGFTLQPNGERHLRPRDRLAEVYPPEALAGTLAMAARCRFRLEEVKYNYPRDGVLPGLTPTQTLRRLTYEGAAQRYPDGIPPPIVAFVEKELTLIAECRYEMFFLTVHDIVRAARRMGILCQGRGSAANSVVCWCLGITAADPEKSNPLLERFISKARQGEPPDIDVDFEHERREEVIQYIYRRYGRHRAALAATVICYRTRSALRDVGTALGVDARLVDAFAKDHHWFDDQLAVHRLGELAHSIGAPAPPALMQLWLELTHQIKGAPRHLSQHVGGFVLTETPLHHLVPVEPAAMARDDDGEDTLGVWPDEPGSQNEEGNAPATSADGLEPEACTPPPEPSPLEPWLPAQPALRQVIQWDKDDLEALGMLKVDVLALGMLTAVRRCIDLVARRRGAAFTRYDIGSEDAATYEMIRKADTIGTFQIESRAQMSMLPRLKPTTFYDLVVQVAIVRPGPITGGMVHPYLKARERRRRGLLIEYERSHHDAPGAEPLLAKALKRTLGIPIFQEQVMELSMLAAGFSAEQADELRRAMAAWKRKGGLGPFEQKLTQGMLKNGYSADFAARIFRQIQGFGEYGFPESHAYSFALIAYESAWLKCHEPEAFLAAMLNSQPMGFYGPSQLIQDARRHGVQVLPPDVTVSDWDCTLEMVNEPNRPSAQYQTAPPAIKNIEFDGVAEPVPQTAALATPPTQACGAMGSTASGAHSAHDVHIRNMASALPQTAPVAIQIEANDDPRPAVRLGLRLIKGLAEASAHRITAARAAQPFTSVDDLGRRALLDARDLRQLAAADALASLAGHRRQQVWESSAARHSPRSLLPRGALAAQRHAAESVANSTAKVATPSMPNARACTSTEANKSTHTGAITAAAQAAQRALANAPRGLLHDAPIREDALALPAAAEGEDIVHDYATLGLTLRRHPLALLRERLARRGVRSSAQLDRLPHGRQSIACGLVIGRQQPGTAKGTIFVTLEDETGPVNVIVWESLRIDEGQRNALLRSQLLAVHGEWQRDKDSGGRVRHLIAHRMHDLTHLLGRLAGLTTSRDFH